jgi:hypothetical protein
LLDPPKAIGSIPVPAWSPPLGNTWMGGGEADEEHEREGDRTDGVDPEGELIERRPDPSPSRRVGPVCRVAGHRNPGFCGFAFRRPLARRRGDGKLPLATGRDRGPAKARWGGGSLRRRDRASEREGYAQRQATSVPLVAFSYFFSFAFASSPGLAPTLRHSSSTPHVEVLPDVDYRSRPVGRSGRDDISPMHRTLLQKPMGGHPGKPRPVLAREAGRRSDR